MKKTWRRAATLLLILFCAVAAAQGQPAETKPAAAEQLPACRLRVPGVNPTRQIATGECSVSAGPGGPVEMEQKNGPAVRCQLAAEERITVGAARPWVAWCGNEFRPLGWTLPSCPAPAPPPPAPLTTRIRVESGGIYAGPGSTVTVSPALSPGEMGPELEPVPGRVAPAPPVPATISSPTLAITPAATSAHVGAVLGFLALFDPDGPGSDTPRDVTGVASWSSLAPGVRAGAPGWFRFDERGAAAVGATYGGLTAAAAVTVSGKNRAAAARGCGGKCKAAVILGLAAGGTVGGLYGAGVIGGNGQPAATGQRVCPNPVCPIGSPGCAHPCP